MVEPTRGNGCACAAADSTAVEVACLQSACRLVAVPGLARVDGIHLRGRVTFWKLYAELVLGL